MTHSAPRAGGHHERLGPQDLGGSLQPAPTSGRGRPRPEGPAQHRRSAWSWHEASTRPPYQLTWHRWPSSWPVTPHLPFPGPSLTPTSPGSFCSDNRGAEEGVAVQSCLARLIQPSSASGMGGGGGLGALFQASTPVGPNQWQGPRHASGIRCARTTAQDRELGEQPR